MVSGVICTEKPLLYWQQLRELLSGPPRHATARSGWQDHTWGPRI
jgi:hypothetical protein